MSCPASSLCYLNAAVTTKFPMCGNNKQSYVLNGITFQEVEVQCLWSPAAGAVSAVTRDSCMSAVILLAPSLSPLPLQITHTSAGAQLSTMYKMYNTQWDQESDDDKNSLGSSSFWSDGERDKDEEEEEKVEIQRVVVVDESKSVAQVEEFIQEDSEEEKPELSYRGNDGEESFADDEERSDADENHSCDSPAPSLMTSGYGTYRPEEGGDYRDDHTITEFDQDSRGDLSETRDDDEDDQSLSSFGGFDEPTHEPDYDEIRPMSVLEDDEHEAEHDCPYEEKPEEVKIQNELLEVSGNEDVTRKRSQLPKFFTGLNKLKGGIDVEESKKYERRESEVEDLHMESSMGQEVVGKADSDNPDESSSNKDIKFIDSKVDSSWQTYAEWEGNIRRKKEDRWCSVSALTCCLSV